MSISDQLLKIKRELITVLSALDRLLHFMEDSDSSSDESERFIVQSPQSPRPVNTTPELEAHLISMPEMIRSESAPVINLDEVSEDEDEDKRPGTPDLLGNAPPLPPKLRRSPGYYKKQCWD
jgi:hypothetical protein